MNFQQFLNNIDVNKFLSSHLFKNINDKDFYKQVLSSVRNSKPIEVFKKNPDAFVEILLSVYQLIIEKKLNYSDYDLYVDYMITHKNPYSLIESLYTFCDDSLNNKLTQKLSSLISSKIIKFVSKDPVLLFKQEFFSLYTEYGFTTPAIELIKENSFNQSLLINSLLNILKFQNQYNLKSQEAIELALLINSKLQQDNLLKTYILLIDNSSMDNACKNISFYSHVFHDLLIKLNFNSFKETVAKSIGFVLLDPNFNHFTLPFIENALKDNDTSIKKSHSYLHDDYKAFLTGLLNNKEASLLFLKEIYPHVPSLFSLYIPFFDFEVFSTIFPLLQNSDLIDLCYHINKRFLNTQQASVYIHAIYTLGNENKAYYYDFFKNNIKLTEILEMINLDYELQNF